MLSKWEIKKISHLLQLCMNRSRTTKKIRLAGISRPLHHAFKRYGIIVKINSPNHLPYNSVHIAFCVPPQHTRNSQRIVIILIIFLKMSIPRGFCPITFLPDFLLFFVIIDSFQSLKACFSSTPFTPSQSYQQYRSVSSPLEQIYRDLPDRTPPQPKRVLTWQCSFALKTSIISFEFMKKEIINSCQVIDPNNILKQNIKKQNFKKIPHEYWFYSIYIRLDIKVRYYLFLRKLCF